MTKDKTMTNDKLFDCHHFISDGFDCYTGFMRAVPDFAGVGSGIEAYPCGYVAIPVGHKFHGKHYDEIGQYVGGLMCGGLASKDGRAFNASSLVRLDGSWFIGFDIGSCGKAGSKTDVIKKIKEITDILKEYK